MSDHKRFNKWTIFNHGKLRLSGEPWDDSNPKERPSLMYKLTNNNPRFLLYTNKQGANGSLPFALDPYIAEQFFELTRKVASKLEQCRYTMELKSSWVGGQKLDKPAVTGKISVGRDAQGIVFLAFKAQNEAWAKFHFKPHFFATILNADGEPLTLEESSSVVATGWANTLSRLTTEYMVTHGKEPAERPGSGKSYSNNGGGGQQRSSASWDNDVDFD